MEKKKKNHSFATRLSRWVMLVLLVMMGIISYVFYDVCVGEIVSIMGNNFHGSMQSSDICISDAMSDVSVAVNNNIFDIERNLSQPDQLQPIMERIVTQNPRIRSCGISFIENYYPKKGRQFRPYAWRTDSMEVKTRQLDDGFEDYLKAEWFTEAIAKDSAYWSRPFVDGRHEARTPLVSYQYPIHDQQGKVVAILDADLSLDFMTQLLDKQDSIFEKDVWLLSDDFGAFKSYVLRSDGTFLTHIEQRRILKGNFFDHVKDYDEPGVAENTIKEMKEVKRSSKETSKPLKVNRKDTYLFYAPVTGTDWILAVTVPKGAIDYFSILLVAFTVICMPFWNATTDAYERGDIQWIRNATRKLRLMIIGIMACMVLMVILSPWVYSIWIGDSITIDIRMSIVMATYIFILIYSMRYSYFINGIGKLRLQLIFTTAAAVIFIPLAYLTTQYTHSIIWFMIVMCLVNIPGLIVNRIQFSKLINGQAKGIWMK